ncbi:MAG: Transcriptional regulator, AraC family [Betaproteobacteria bacterium]|nr:Transcriptional regulator, AraC family [Betaproteobacteria bacterium]
MPDAARQWRKPKLVDSPSLDLRPKAARPSTLLTEYTGEATMTGWHRHAFGQFLTPARGTVRVLTKAWLTVVPAGYGVWVPPQTVHAVAASHGSLLSATCVATPAAAARMEADRVSALIRREDFQPALPGRVLKGARVGEWLRGVPIPNDRRARPIAFRLMAAPHDQRSLAEWGALLGASERTLARVFQADAGMGFREWRQRLQIAEALAVLLNGEPVKAAAATVGYAGASAFVAAFRALAGMTPLHYLRELR